MSQSRADAPAPTTDLPEPSRFSFGPVIVSRRESELSATVTVVREGGTSGVSNVTIASTNGTAFAGSDYTALPPTTLTFQDAQASQTVTIPILQDSLAEGDESFFLNRMRWVE